VCFFVNHLGVKKINYRGKVKKFKKFTDAAFSHH